MRLSYSGRLFARVSRRCDQPALFAGHAQSTHRLWRSAEKRGLRYASTAVKRVLSGRSRDENLTFRAFAGSLATPIAFAAPAKGNEKGGVEGANHYLQDNFFTPLLDAASVDEINTDLAGFCIKDQQREHSVHHEVIADRFARELVALRSSPRPLPRACVTHPAHVNKFSEITVDTNRYSVPTKYAHRAAFVEDPRHSVDLLAHKHRASLSTAVVSDGRLPDAFLTLRDRYLTRSEGHATKAWTTVLLLLKEHPRGCR